MTILLKIASRSRHISTCLGLFLFALSILVYGRYSGFLAADRYATAFYGKFGGCLSTFTADGSTLYEVLSNYSFYIACLLLIVLGVQIFTNNRWRTLSTALLLILISYLHWNVYRIKYLKNQAFPEVDETHFVDLMRQIIPIDIASWIIIIFLFIIQLIVVFSINSRSPVSRPES